jgi:hypothetical protein
MHSEEAVVNPLEAQQASTATTQRSEKNSVSLKAEQDSTKTLPATTDDSSTATASKEETDAEFLQRMEEEDQKNFALAVDNWRAEKKAGKGEAKIVEVGGGFIRGAEEKNTDSVDVKVGTTGNNGSRDQRNNPRRFQGRGKGSAAIRRPKGRRGPGNWSIYSRCDCSGDCSAQHRMVRLG